MRLVITFLNLGVNIKGFISGEDVALLIEILADSQSMSSFFSCIIGMIANRDISELQVLGRKSLETTCYITFLPWASRHLVKGLEYTCQNKMSYIAGTFGFHVLPLEPKPMSPSYCFSCLLDMGQIPYIHFLCYPTMQHSVPE